MANESIKANDGVVLDWVKVEAATRGAKIAVDEYGQAVVSASNTATSSLGQVQAAAQSLSASFKAVSFEALDEASRAKQAAINAADAATAKSRDSQPIDTSTKVDLETRYKAGTLTSADLTAAKGNLEAAKNNAAIMYQSLKGSASSYDASGIADVNASLRSAQSIVDRLTSGKSGAPKPAPAPPTPAPTPAPTAAPASAPTQQAQSTSHTVTINMGTASTTFATATERDSQKAVAFLQTLESAARSAGY